MVSPVGVSDMNGPTTFVVSTVGITVLLVLLMIVYIPLLG
jgi:hypothetical protein